MEFKTIPGKKGPRDKILFIKTCGEGGWEAIKLWQWLKIARFKGHVEDNAYPYPKRGRYKLIDFLRDGLKKKSLDEYQYTISEVCKKHDIEE